MDQLTINAVEDRLRTEVNNISLEAIPIIINEFLNLAIVLLLRGTILNFFSFFLPNGKNR